ncbi:MAG: RrF2 family transcriptional regulator [Bacteriovoracaceae bacterium]|jgi:Rrf2 family protein
MVDTRFSVSIQIMMTLAAHENELYSSESLAKVLKTNATFIRKLVTHLVDAGLVSSFRGKGGGIKLARTSSLIDLNEIYLAATGEKPLISIHNKPITKACAVSCCINDVLEGIVLGIEESTQKYLQGKTLHDLMIKVK